MTVFQRPVTCPNCKGRQWYIIYPRIGGVRVTCLKCRYSQFFPDWEQPEWKGKGDGKTVGVPIVEEQDP